MAYFSLPNLITASLTPHRRLRKRPPRKPESWPNAKRKKPTTPNDVSADSYGELPMVGSPEYKPSNLPRVSLADIAELEDKEIVFRCWVENARVQSAKLAFLEPAPGAEYDSGCCGCEREAEQADGQIRREHLH